MAARRLSRLQRRILTCLFLQHQRTQGRLAMGHFELVRVVRGDKSNISHSLRTLETRGLITIGRTPGGKADSVDLTTEGQNMASRFAKVVNKE